MKEKPTKCAVKIDEDMQKTPTTKCQEVQLIRFSHNVHENIKIRRSINFVRYTNILRSKSFELNDLL